MNLISILSFSGAMFLLAVTPGPGVFTVLGRTLKSGFRKTLFTTAGIVTGDLIYLSFALSGLTWLARNAQWIFTAVRIGGGIYLIYLGIRSILGSRAPREEELPSRGGDSPAPDRGIHPAACYSEGLLITISNPKAILFYCSFLPAFMNLQALGPRDILTVALIVSVTLAVVMSSYSLLAEHTGRRMGRNSGALNKASGALMITAGSVLALKR